MWNKCSGKTLCDLLSWRITTIGGSKRWVAQSVAQTSVGGQDGRRWGHFALIVAAQFMVVLDVAIVNVALPSIKNDLGFSQESLQWVITAYAIFFGGVLLLGGRLADLLGRRRLFMVGLLIFTVSSLLDGLAWSEGSLIVFRSLQGLGAALLSPAALSILTTTFREGRERNLALGVWGAASGSGGAAGVLLGGALTSALSWSWIFFINVPAGILVLAVSPWLLKESRADLAHRHFDFAGAASITGGLMLLVYAMTRATGHGWATTETIGLLVASAALIVAFLVIEARSTAPLLPMRIFRLRTLTASNVSGLLMGGAIFSQFFLLTLYMQQVLHYSALKTGVAYIALTVTIISFSAVAQAMATRFGIRRTLPVGLALSAGALISLRPASGGRALRHRPVAGVPAQRNRAGDGLRPDVDRRSHRRSASRRGGRIGLDHHQSADRRRDRSCGSDHDCDDLHNPLRHRASRHFAACRSCADPRLPDRVLRSGRRRSRSDGRCGDGRAEAGRGRRGPRPSGEADAVPQLEAA